MPSLIVLGDSAKNRALLDPNFRELLTAAVSIKKNRGIDLLDYDSIDDFTMAFLSSMNTNQLKLIKRILDSSGTPDEVVDAVLEARLTDTTISAVNN